MEIILDTSFILTCLKEKVDFLQAEEYGSLILPKQVLAELEKIKEKGVSKERELASLALQIVEKNKKKFRIINLEGKLVDLGILKYAEGRENIIVATLDKNLKRQLRGKARLLVIRARKKLQLDN